MKKFILLSTILAIAASPAFACPNNANHCATINYSSGGGTGITGYNIYRSSTSGGCASVSASSCTKVGSNPNSSGTFVDSPLAASTTYFWVVTAVNAAGESAPSSEASFTTSGDPVPNPPTNVTVTGQ